jgi:hypothetical protein
MVGALVLALTNSSKSWVVQISPWNSSYCCVESLVAIFLEQRKLREHGSGDGVLLSCERDAGEHEGHESYLWMGSVEAGVTGGGPAVVTVPVSIYAHQKNGSALD